MPISNAANSESARILVYRTQQATGGASLGSGDPAVKAQYHRLRRGQARYWRLKARADANQRQC